MLQAGWEATSYVQSALCPVSTPPAVAHLTSPLLLRKMAPRGQGVPCIPQERAPTLYYLMELWPQNRKHASPCLSFLPP